MGAVRGYAVELGCSGTGGGGPVGAVGAVDDLAGSADGDEAVGAVGNVLKVAVEIGVTRLFPRGSVGAPDYLAARRIVVQSNCDEVRAAVGDDGRRTSW